MATCSNMISLMSVLNSNGYNIHKLFYIIEDIAKAKIPGGPPSSDDVVAINSVCNVLDRTPSTTTIAADAYITFLNLAVKYNQDDPLFAEFQILRTKVLVSGILGQLSRHERHEYDKLCWAMTVDEYRKSIAMCKELLELYSYVAERHYCGCPANIRAKH